jgi:hypothetical protein
VNFSTLLPFFPCAAGATLTEPAQPEAATISPVHRGAAGPRARGNIGGKIIVAAAAQHAQIDITVVTILAPVQQIAAHVMETCSIGCF